MEIDASCMIIEIADIDLQKSQQMFNEREEFEKACKEFEKRQRAFIEEIIEKYNIKTKEDYDKVFGLFPESASRFLYWNSFRNE